MASPKLDVRDLQVVMAISSAGSTVRAAAILHLTQSAVSRALALAEEKLGQPIFARSAQGLAPTAAGRTLVEGGAAILRQLADLEAEATAPADPPLAMRIACECYTAYRWLPSALAALHRNQPNVDITLAIEHTASPVPALLNGTLDVALVTTSKVRGGLVSQPLFSDEVVFVVSASHPLAAKSALSLRDLEDYPLIVSSQTPKPETSWFMKAVFGKTKPRLQRIQFPLTEAILDAARAGMGIAIMSEWIAEPYLANGDLRAMRLRGKAIRRPWRIAYPKKQAAAAAKLAAALTPPSATRSGAR